jgi:hypothetical protein
MHILLHHWVYYYDMMTLNLVPKQYFPPSSLPLMMARFICVRPLSLGFYQIAPTTRRRAFYFRKLVL